MIDPLNKTKCVGEKIFYSLQNVEIYLNSLKPSSLVTFAHNDHQSYLIEKRNKDNSLVWVAVNHNFEANGKSGAYFTSRDISKVIKPEVINDENKYTIYLHKEIVDSYKENTTNSNESKRYNQGKPEFSLVPYDALEQAVYVFMFGKIKYGAFNWLKGGEAVTVESCKDSSIRHTVAMQRGDMFDKESGLSHQAHVLCNELMAMKLMMKRGLDKPITSYSNPSENDTVYQDWTEKWNDLKSKLNS